MGGVAHVFGTAHQAEDLFCQCAVIFFFCHLQFLHDGLIRGDPEPAAQKLCVSHTGQPADRVEVDHSRCGNHTGLCFLFRRPEQPAAPGTVYDPWQRTSLSVNIF